MFKVIEGSEATAAEVIAAEERIVTEEETTENRNTDDPKEANSDLKPKKTLSFKLIDEDNAIFEAECIKKIISDGPSKDEGFLDEFKCRFDRWYIMYTAKETQLPVSIPVFCLPDTPSLVETAVRPELEKKGIFLFGLGKDKLLHFGEFRDAWILELTKLEKT